MLLRRLELSGFKSFARPTALEFTTPITAVVGPNGSGKSNIVEAMRFVLGEQSMKSLRGKRGEDLIFHGSKSLARQNRASVAVVFQNAKHAFPIDYDEVEIKRIVYRDGVNQYFINGSRSRLKDILELLASVHIGAGSHHIISQGETDHILAASIQERRGMVEDALGIKAYHYKLSESERKLQKTKENLAQTETLRKEIASHLAFIGKQVDKIRHAEALRDELAVLYKEYLQGEKCYLDAERERLQKEKGNPKRGLEETRKKIREKETLLETASERAEILQKTGLFEEKIREAQKEKDTLSRALGRLEGLIEYEEREMERAKLEGGTAIAFSREHIRSFLESVRQTAFKAEHFPDIESLKAAVRGIKDAVISFFKQEGKKPEASDETLAKLRKEHEDTAHAFSRAKEKESALARDYADTRKSFEETRGAERLLEKELFLLRIQENELATHLELYLYREGRLQEEEARIREEIAEAGRLFGMQALRFGEEKIPHLPIPDKKEQEKKRQKIERIKIRIEETGGGGADILREYEEVKERDGFLAKETNDLLRTAEALETLIKELSERIETEFKEGILKINKEFHEIFSSLFGGGSASLVLVSPPTKKKSMSLEGNFLEIPEETSSGASASDEEEEEGVDISVNMPTKRVKSLRVLSGGERSLTSIALVFAITLVHPPPFLILDETDAALDEANSEKYGELLLKLKERTQFIIITHNRETMMRAGALYGVTASPDGASRILSVKLDEAEEIAE